MYFTSDSTWNQTQIFFGLIFAGMVLGVIYTFFYAKKPNENKKIMPIVLDVVFCIISFFIVGIALYVLDNGKIQLYMWVGVIVGFLCSLYLFSRPVKITINKVNKLIYFVNERLIKHKK